MPETVSYGGTAIQVQPVAMVAAVTMGSVVVSCRTVVVGATVGSGVGACVVAVVEVSVGSEVDVWVESDVGA